jgi:inner membrane protein involved in colicin E2 resistance
MRDFLLKITSSKTNKIIFCVVIAVPIWLIVSFINKDPGETVEATIVDTTISVNVEHSEVVSSPSVSVPDTTITTNETEVTTHETTVEETFDVTKTHSENVTENMLEAVETND